MHSFNPSNLRARCGVAFMLLLSACDPYLGDISAFDVSVLVENDPFVSQVAPWDDVICTFGTDARCYAHTPDADELWFPVVSWCELQHRLDEGEYIASTTQWNEPCDLGGVPTMFDSVMCFEVEADLSTCFGGADGWYVAVEPGCATDAYTLEAWPTGSCDSDFAAGNHGFDSISVAPTIFADWGRVKYGNDAFYTVPECAVPPGEPAADPYAC